MNTTYHWPDQLRKVQEQPIVAAPAIPPAPFLCRPRI